MVRRPARPARSTVVATVLLTVAASAALAWQLRAPTSAPGAAVDLPDPASLATGTGDDPSATAPSEPAPTDATGRRCPTATGDVACVVWAATAEPAARQAARVAGDAVVSVLPDGTVQARSADTGAVRWTSTVTPARDPLLLAAVAGTQPVLHHDRLTFLRLEDGVALGEVVLDGPPADVVTHGASTVVAHPRRVTSYLVTGTAAWSLSVPDDRIARLTSSGTYLLGAAEVTRLASDTGEPRWTTAVGPAPLALEAPLRGHQLVTTGIDRATLHALAIEDGTVAWELPLDGPVRDVVTSSELLVAVVRGGDGIVVHTARLAPDGSLAGPAARTPLPVSLTAGPPAIAGPTVAIASAVPTSTVHLLSGDGLLLGPLTLPAPVGGLALPDPGTVVTTDRRSVTAFAVSTGAVRWRVALDDPTIHATRPLIVSSGDGLTVLRSRPPAILADPPAGQRGSRS